MDQERDPSPTGADAPTLPSTPEERLAPWSAPVLTIARMPEASLAPGAGADAFALASNS